MDNDVTPGAVVYLDDAKEADLSDDIEDAVRGEVESVDEVDGLLALRVTPTDGGLMGSNEILRRLGVTPFCA